MDNVKDRSLTNRGQSLLHVQGRVVCLVGASRHCPALSSASSSSSYRGDPVQASVSTRRGAPSIRLFNYAYERLYGVAYHRLANVVWHVINMGKGSGVGDLRNREQKVQ